MLLQVYTTLHQKQWVESMLARKTVKHTLCQCRLDTMENIRSCIILLKDDVFEASKTKSNRPQDLRNVTLAVQITYDVNERYSCLPIPYHTRPIR
ncbi:hypothetical protein TNCV_1209961 [Trichonephila clavipes]|nr:hypothetical protein TNCV_1209961 [Trichonephila clavipes]